MKELSLGNAQTTLDLHFSSLLILPAHSLSRLGQRLEDLGIYEQRALWELQKNTPGIINELEEVVNKKGGPGEERMQEASDGRIITDPYKAENLEGITSRGSFRIGGRSIVHNWPYYRALSHIDLAFYSINL